jgi:hypothetical protein
MKARAIPGSATIIAASASPCALPAPLPAAARSTLTQLAPLGAVLKPLVERRGRSLPHERTSKLPSSSPGSLPVAGLEPVSSLCKLCPSLVGCAGKKGLHLRQLQRNLRLSLTVPFLIAWETVPICRLKVCPCADCFIEET